MVRHLRLERMHQVEQFLLLRGEQAVEAAGRNQQSPLAAEVVAAENQVDPPLASRQNAFDVAQVEAMPLLHNEQVDRVFCGDVKEDLLHAPSEGHAVDEILDGGSAAAIAASGYCPQRAGIAL